MHGYYITAGYQSGYMNSGYWEDAWLALKQAVEGYRQAPVLVTAEVREYGLPGSLDADEFEEYVVQFEERAYEIIEIKEDSSQDDGFYIVMIAAGGETLRRTQELYGRALCRLLLRDMHRLSFEISVNVT
jgi:hypothetical protein